MPTSLPVVAFTLPVFFSPRTLLVSRRHAGLILPPAIAGEVQSPRLAHFDRSSTPDVLPFPSFHPRFACHGPRLLHLHDDAHHLLLLRFVVLDRSATCKLCQGTTPKLPTSGWSIWCGEVTRNCAYLFRSNPKASEHTAFPMGRSNLERPAHACGCRGLLVWTSTLR